MVFAVSVCELQVPASRSLKHKRKVVRSLVDRIHARFRVSIAETGHHDLHQRAQIGIAAVHQSEQEIETMMEAIRSILETTEGAVVLAWESQILEGVE